MADLAEATLAQDDVDRGESGGKRRQKEQCTSAGVFEAFNGRVEGVTPKRRDCRKILRRMRHYLRDHGTISEEGFILMQCVIGFRSGLFPFQKNLDTDDARWHSWFLEYWL